MVHFGIDLKEVYSIELKFRSKIIDHFKSLGIEEMLEDMENEPIKLQLSLWGGKPIIEIIGGRYGCEQARALYELGVRIIPMKYMIYDGQECINEITTYTPIKLKNIPLVDLEEYSKYIREIGGEEIYYS